jgi:hypothetical protein
MSIIRAIKCVIGGVGHWLQEAYCVIGQRVGEQLECASDALATKRYLAGQRAQESASGRTSSQQILDVPSFRVINGHKHPN